LDETPLPIGVFGLYPAPSSRQKSEDLVMSTALIIILLALLLGGVGLAIEAMRWLLIVVLVIVALVLVIVGALSGWRRTV
jgi:hypothetical protein